MRGSRLGQLRRRAFHGLESLLGAGHEETSRALIALARVLGKRDKFQEAESRVRQALRVSLKNFGPGDKATLIALSGLAHILAFQAGVRKLKQ